MDIQNDKSEHISPHNTNSIYKEFINIVNNNVDISQNSQYKKLNDSNTSDVNDFITDIEYKKILLRFYKYTTAEDFEKAFTDEDFFGSISCKTDILIKSVISVLKQIDDEQNIIQNNHGLNNNSNPSKLLYPIFLKCRTIIMKPMELMMSITGILGNDEEEIKFLGVLIHNYEYFDIYIELIRILFKLSREMCNVERNIILMREYVGTTYQLLNDIVERSK